jgi:hypothetical protein
VRVGPCWRTASSRSIDVLLAIDLAVVPIGHIDVSALDERESYVRLVVSRSEFISILRRRVSSRCRVSPMNSR